LVIDCFYYFLVGLFYFGLLLVILDHVGAYGAFDLVNLFFAKVFLYPDFSLMHFYTAIIINNTLLDKFRLYPTLL